MQTFLMQEIKIQAQVRAGAGGARACGSTVDILLTECPTVKINTYI